MGNEKKPSRATRAYSPQLVDAREIARLTGIPLQTIWRGARDGVLPHFRLARTVRFDPDEILELIRQESTSAAADEAHTAEDCDEPRDSTLLAEENEWWPEQ